MTRRFYPHIGGVEKHILKVSEQLVAEGHGVSILAENHAPSEVQDGWSNQKNLPVCFVGFGKESTLKKFRIWLRMLCHMKLFVQADVIHAHDVMFWCFLIRILLFWKPIYTTFHGDEKRFPPTRKAVWMRKISATCAHRCINVGSYLEKWYGVKADVTIWGGVEKPASQRQKMARSPLCILLLGRLDTDISIRKYGEIVCTLKTRSFPFKFDVCGDGPASTVLLPYGKMHGFVDDVNPYIARSHIVFCSSYLAILEALSYKKRVIAFYENDMKKDYLTRSPFAQWICITQSVEEAVMYCLEYGNKPFSPSESLALEKYCESISWKAIADQYLRLWSK